RVTAPGFHSMSSAGKGSVRRLQLMLMVVGTEVQGGNSLPLLARLADGDEAVDRRRRLGAGLGVGRPDVREAAVEAAEEDERVEAVGGVPEGALAGLEERSFAVAAGLFA